MISLLILRETECTSKVSIDEKSKKSPALTLRLREMKYRTSSYQNLLLSSKLLLPVPVAHTKLTGKVGIVCAHIEVSMAT